MKLELTTPPHIRVPDSNGTIMRDTIIAILPIYCLAFFFYCPRVLISAMLSVGVSVAADSMGILLAGKKMSLSDLSAVITGLIIPLLMPASVRYGIIIAADVFAIWVAKQPFGGLGQNIFNPAAAGVAFVTICWWKEIFSYPTPGARLPIESIITTKMMTSPAFVMKLNGIPQNDYMDMLMGNMAGPMGTTGILVLIACFIYLVVRKIASLKISGAYFAVVVLIAICFPRANMTIMQSVLYEFMSGSLLFGAIFLLNDPATSPQRDLSRIIYGAFTGLVVMLFRRFGKFEDGVVFAILFSNSFVWDVDMICEKIQRKLRKKVYENR